MNHPSFPCPHCEQPVELLQDCCFNCGQIIKPEDLPPLPILAGAA